MNSKEKGTLVGQQLMGTLAGQVREQGTERGRREDSLKKDPESLHGFLRRPDCGYALATIPSHSSGTSGP